MTKIRKKFTTKYIHNEKVHNLKASQDFVAYIYSVFRPKTVIDIGCGLGNFLYDFKELGVDTVLGVDGFWVEEAKRSLYLKDSEFRKHNLELPLYLDRKYDLVLSLEVAEHLSENVAETHVKNLINAGDIIVFSAAIPFQGGQNHLNEQWQSYWTKLFNEEDYIVYDIIRPNLWNNENIPWWYRQNSFVYINKSIEKELPSNHISLLDVVHPNLFKAKEKKIIELNERYQNMIEGKMSVGFYSKLFLKSIINRFK